MKKLLLTLLMVCLLVVPAYAEEVPDQTVEDSLQENPVTVETLDELQKAIVAVEEGDTIIISAGITIWEDDIVETDKSIVLKRDTSFSAGPLFYIGRNGILRGFTIIDTNGWKNTLEVMDSATVQNCYFQGSDNHNGQFIFIRVGTWSKSLISDCTFMNNGTVAIENGYGTDVVCDNCVFTGNKSYAISNCSNMKITNCIITENWCSGICALSNTTTIMQNCQVYGNIAYDPKNGNGTDLCIDGTLIIEGEPIEGKGYFDEITGTKIELPYECCGELRLIYLTDMQAIEHFSPKEPLI